MRPGSRCWVQTNTACFRRRFEAFFACCADWAASRHATRIPRRMTLRRSNEMEGKRVQGAPTMQNCHTSQLPERVTCSEPGGRFGGPTVHVGPGAGVGPVAHWDGWTFESVEVGLEVVNIKASSSFKNLHVDSGLHYSPLASAALLGCHLPLCQLIHAFARENRLRFFLNTFVSEE